MCVFVSCAVPQRQEGSDLLELELQVVVSHWMWVPITEFGSSARAASSLQPVCVLVCADPCLGFVAGDCSAPGCSEALLPGERRLDKE